VCCRAATRGEAATILSVVGRDVRVAAFPFGVSRHDDGLLELARHGVLARCHSLVELRTTASPSLPELVALLPNLRVLEVREVYRSYLLDDHLALGILGKLQGPLTRLAFYGGLGLEAVRGIAALPGLEEVCVSSPAFDRTCVEALLESPTLRRLELGRASSGFDAQAASLDSRNRYLGPPVDGGTDNLEPRTLSSPHRGFDALAAEDSSPSDGAAELNSGCWSQGARTLSFNSGSAFHDPHGLGLRARLSVLSSARRSSDPGTTLLPRRIRGFGVRSALRGRAKASGAPEADSGDASAAVGMPLRAPPSTHRTVRPRATLLRVSIRNSDFAESIGRLDRAWSYRRTALARTVEERPMPRPADSPHPTLSFVEALASRRAHLLALDSKKLREVRIDITVLHGRALGVSQRLQAFRGPLIATFGPAAGELLDSLVPAAHAARQADVELRGIPKRRHVAPMHAALVAKHALLLVDAKALVARGLFPAEVVRKATDARGYLSATRSVLLLTSLFRSRWTEIADFTPTTLEDLAEAQRLAGALVDAAATADTTPEHAAAADLRRRAVADAVRIYEELRRQMSYLRWHQGDVDTIVPSLFAGRGGRKKRRSREGGPAVS
jgi:hypothetical protein